MYRIFDLFKKQPRIQPTTCHHSIRTKSDPRQARTAATTTTTSLTSEGMREVHAFLNKSKSAISSLSFSSTATGDEGCNIAEEKKSGDYANPLLNTPCPTVKDHRKGAEKAPLGTTNKSAATPRLLVLSQVSTVLNTSKTCEGRFIARIVPKRYAEYDTHKPLAQKDPATYINLLESWRRHQEEGGGNSGYINNQYQKQKEQKPVVVSSDEESVVVLDLYLLRSAYFDDEPQTSSDGIEDDCAIEITQQRRREQRIQSMMSAYDVTRNDSSHKRNSNSLKSSRRLQATCITEEDAISSTVTASENDIDTTKSISSTITAEGYNHIGNVACEELSNNLFYLHMNRSSTEDFANRTLHRLELSVTRKLQSFSPYIKNNSNASIKRLNRGKEGNLALINKSTTSKLILVDEEASSTTAEGIVCKEVDLTGWSSAGILQTMFSERNTDGSWAVALTIPKVIIPWNDVDGEDEVMPLPQENSVCSSTSSAFFKPVETIGLDITINPPTILAIRTFENFTGELYTGVPLVIETDAIYSTRAVITWFVNGQVTLHDSKMYTPTEEDIGKKISVLVTPIRPGHNGQGCQEVYAFKNTVNPLADMPIVSLRDEWLKTHSGSCYMQNNLRVVTYNILADMYAGREIECHLMYGHCDVQDLLRQRRMPMIISELLSYKADVICLQEVDAAIHNALLAPVLEANGYQGFYSNKVSSQQEGCSMFWSTEAFELTGEEDMQYFPLRSLLAGEEEREYIHRDRELTRQMTQYYDAKSNVKDMEIERWESIEGIHHLFDTHDEVRKVYRESVGQIVQVVRLTPKQSSEGSTPKPESIVVANTHLFYHPMADHIRVLQAYAVCHKLDKIRREGIQADPVLIVGDFNSSPLSGAVRLLTHRSVLPHENDCWKHLNVYRWECGDNEYMLDHGYIGNLPAPGELVDPCYIDEEFVDAHSEEDSMENTSILSTGDASSNTTANDVIHPPAIELPSSFPILASGCLTVPQFTNYAVDFVETLDYVFASRPSEREPFGFEPKGEAPMLDEETVKKYVAMPNEAMPSDHVSVVCDFEWAKK